MSALDKRRVFAVGVFDTKEKRWARMASDDREVRRELTKVNRYGGKVVVRLEHVGKLSARYSASSRGVGVEQSPTVVVVDRNRQAACSSATSTATRSTRRSPTPVATAPRCASRTPTVRSLNRTCANFDIRLTPLQPPGDARPGRAGLPAASAA